MLRKQGELELQPRGFVVVNQVKTHATLGGRLHVSEAFYPLLIVWEALYLSPKACYLREMRVQRYNNPIGYVHKACLVIKRNWSSNNEACFVRHMPYRQTQMELQRLSMPCKSHALLPNANGIPTVTGSSKVEENLSVGFVLALKRCSTPIVRRVSTRTYPFINRGDTIAYAKK